EAQALVMGELERAIEGAAEAAGGTMNGQLTILGNAFSDLVEEVGNGFLPVLRDLASWVTEFAQDPAFQEWARSVGGAIGETLKVIVIFVNVTMQKLSELRAGALEFQANMAAVGAKVAAFFGDEKMQAG